MNTLTKEQIKKIIAKRYIMDYLVTYDVAEYYGFNKGVDFILTLLCYSNDLDQIYYDFERFINEQKFLDKTNRKLNADDILNFAESFFESQPSS